MTRALDRLWAGQAGAQPVMLLPGQTKSPSYSAMTARHIGRFSGQAWEQMELPFAARGGLLVSLGNAAPIAQPRQVVVIHDAGVFITPESYSRRFVLWYRWLHRRLARSGAQIVTVSRSARADISRCLGLAEQRIAVVAEGGEHILRTPPNFDVLARHCLQPGRFVLAVGNLARHKNLALLSRAAERLAARGHALVLTGGLANAVYDHAATEAVPHTCLRLGRVDDASLRALYEAASCLVMPSRYEGYGLPAVEAMACGCPVVAARSGALPEVCNGAAHFFDAGDACAASQAIIDVVENPNLSHSLRQRGLARAEQLTWARAADSFAKIVAKSAAGALENERPPSPIVEGIVQ